MKRSSGGRDFADHCETTVNDQPVEKSAKREEEPAPAPAVAELQQKVAKLEKDYQGATRTARAAQLRVEFLENLLEKKSTTGDDAAAKGQVEELQKKLDETSKQLEETSKKFEDTSKQLEETSKQLAETSKQLEETSKQLEDARKDGGGPKTQSQEQEAEQPRSSYDELRRYHLLEMRRFADERKRFFERIADLSVKLLQCQGGPKHPLVSLKPSPLAVKSQLTTAAAKQEPVAVKKEEPDEEKAAPVGEEKPKQQQPIVPAHKSNNSLARELHAHAKMRKIANAHSSQDSPSIFRLYPAASQSLESIGYDDAIGQLRARYHVGDETWCAKYEQAVKRERFACSMCGATSLTGVHILLHFFSTKHAEKVRSLNAAVSLVAFEYWKQKLESIPKPARAAVVSEDIDDDVEE